MLSSPHAWPVAGLPGDVLLGLWSWFWFWFWFCGWTAY